MATMDSEILTDEGIKCGICNDFFEDPTTLPCGHSFCMKCIADHWDSNLYEVIYDCPKCLKSFVTRPELATNETLAVLGKQLQTIRLKESVQNSVMAELQLRCRKPQAQSRGKMKAKEERQQLMCVQHEKILNFYCRDHKQCICETCNTTEHRGHNTVTAAEERKEREKKVKEFLQKARAEIYDRESNLQNISNMSDIVKLISTLEKMKEELNRTIQEQEEVLVSQAQKEETEQKVSIRSRQAAIANLEILSDVKEDIFFIQKSQSITSQQEADVVLLHMNESLSFEFIISVIYTLKQVLEDGCKDAVGKVMKTVRDVQLLDKQKHPGRPSVHRSLTSVGGPRPTVFQRRMPKMRKDFMKYACPPILDADTAHPSLNISNANIRPSIKRSKKLKASLKRFDCWEQVLCKEGLRGGRFYWEVEWSGKGVFIGLALEGIARKGEGAECVLGRNVNSWCLQCSDVSHFAWHNNVMTAIAVNVSSPRIGICLDYNAGTIAFYSVSDKMTLLHEFTSEKFSEPLYPAFGLGLGLQSWIKICNLDDK